jgi:hypothetical protein
MQCYFLGILINNETPCLVCILSRDFVLRQILMMEGKKVHSHSYLYLVFSWFNFTIAGVDCSVLQIASAWSIVLRLQRHRNVILYHCVRPSRLHMTKGGPRLNLTWPPPNLHCQIRVRASFPRSIRSPNPLSFSWKADSHLVSQEILRIIWSPNIH